MSSIPDMVCGFFTNECITFNSQMARRFVMGDVHGAYRAMEQCFARAHFDYEQDMLIHLGDVCDGWPETRQCIDELLKIRNLVYVLGNHDFHTLQWALYNDVHEGWLEQGGRATQQSYNYTMPGQHVAFLRAAKPFWIDENKLFVHAGIWPGYTPDQHGLSVLLWDRTLVESALALHRSGSNQRLTPFDEVYLGHTPIGLRPIRGGEVWMMDTGAGWNGVLSMMDLDTKEVFTSDAVPGLYPGVVGRRRQR